MPDAGARPLPERPHHHTDSGFRNPPGSPTRGRIAFGTMWRFMRRMQAERKQAVALPDGHVWSREQVRSGLARHAGADSITWLGHAAFLLRLGGKTVLTDPYLEATAGPRPWLGPKRFVPAALSPAELPPVDIIAISHSHYDHLDALALQAMPDKERVEVVVPLRLGSLLRELGFRNVTELDWHDTATFGAVTLTALPAVHGSARSLWDQNRTLWASYGIRAGNRHLWFGGDTAWGPVFQEVGRRHGPFDLAMIGIGAYEPRAIMESVHANPEEAVRIGRDLAAARLVGMHWGTVRLTFEPILEPPVRFRAAARAAGYADEHALTMAIGETQALP